MAIPRGANPSPGGKGSGRGRAHRESRISDARRLPAPPPCPLPPGEVSRRLVLPGHAVRPAGSVLLALLDESIELGADHDLRQLGDYFPRDLLDHLAGEA